MAWGIAGEVYDLVWTEKAASLLEKAVKLLFCGSYQSIRENLSPAGFADAFERKCCNNLERKIYIFMRILIYVLTEIYGGGNI